ncbi:hypothetical protein PGQ11_011965 [Apiospora arundinis]|uniref:SRR1-like domain-containing protein n=1 Tax=Apiospora arundinis TaxID=335852 RepID=A0ABR2I1R6_9PEZI
MVSQISSQLDGSIVSGSDAKASFSDIQAAYDAGLPLFSKDALRAMGAQPQQYRDGTQDKTTLRAIGVDGHEMDYIADAADRKHIRISYESIQALTTGDGLWEGVLSNQKFFAAAFAHITEYTGQDSSQEDLDVATVAERARINEMPTTGLYTAFMDETNKWKKTEPFMHEMRRIWDANKVASAGVDNIVAFACGPLIWNSQIAVHSILQHALILSLRDYLLEKGSSHVDDYPCYAQDPAYSDRDKAVLGSLGITTLEDPNGFLKADDHSIVLSFYPNVPVKQIIADLCRPAVIIWGTPMDYPCTDPDSTRVDEMLQKEYDRVDLPYDDAFHPTVMYCKKT